jgi:hypothetical protein
MNAIVTRTSRLWIPVLAIALFAAAAPTAYGQAGGGSGNGAYIDSAIPFSHVRLRYDAGFDNVSPDRAEFFYGKCGCFRGAPAPFTDPTAPGPPQSERSVDYQDVAAYAEYALCDIASVFAEFPIRFLNPEVNDNTGGLGDINVGFKYAFCMGCDQYVTFQLRAYLPTGDADRGLGTDHVSLEPGILLYKQLSDKLVLEAEVKDWIPLGGTDFAGNVIRYGVGLSCTVVDCPQHWVAPVVELVGWTVLDGKRLENDQLFDASGDTIVNAKLGVRVGLRDGCGNTMADFYAGYGRALTDEWWYRDIFRLEMRLRF